MEKLRLARGWTLAFLFVAGFVHAQTPALSGRIAFISPEGRLATVAPDGSELRVLSEPGQRFQFPAWSPDGRIAAIAADADGAAVYALADAEDAAPAELYRSVAEPPIYLYWSPGGETVSFIANRSGEDGGGRLGFHLASLEAGSSRLLATGNPFYWDWSADGESVFVHTGFVGEGARLAFIGVDAQAGADEAENLAPPGFFQAPGISPSGRFVAYAEVDEGGRGRVVVRGNPQQDDAGEDGDEARELPHEGLVALQWSPTEDVLALSSPPVSARSFYGPIRLLDAETGDLNTLVDDLSVAFFWSPNGRYVAYLSPETGGGGGVAGGPDETLVTHVASAQTQPPFLNATVVEVPSGEVLLRTSFLPTPLFLGQFLPFFDQYALSHSLWSPQSDALVLPTFDTGEPLLLVLPLEGEARTIAAGDMPFWSR